MRAKKVRKRTIANITKWPQHVIDGLRLLLSGKALHKKSEEYRNGVRRKMAAYHRYIQSGVIAQGLLQYISSAFPQLVWASFGSWIRTIRPGICPSEQVTAVAVKNTIPEFLIDSSQESILTKSIIKRIDLTLIFTGRISITITPQL